MLEFSVSSPKVEVRGEVLLAFVAGFPHAVQDFGTEILQRNGLPDPKPGQWYNFQAFMDSMKQISEKFGGAMLNRIGQQICNYAKIPPEIDSVEKFMESNDKAYHMSHQGGDIGYYK